MNRPAHPVVKAIVGGKAPSSVGVDALMDFRMEVSLDGETLTDSRNRKHSRAIRRTRAGARQMG